MEVIGEVTLGSEGIENAAEIIEEDEFRVRYLPEVQCAEMAINFIAAEKWKPEYSTRRFTRIWNRGEYDKERVPSFIE